jgi:hypothetical protein
VLGSNPQGVSDKTLAVVKFDALDGKPIAFLINYPVHAVVMSAANLDVSGDLAGATSRYVERHYGCEEPGRPRSDAGSALSAPVPGTTPIAIWTSGAAGDQNAISLARASDFTMVEGLGRLLADEAIRVAAKIRTSPRGRLRAAQTVVTCPGQKASGTPQQYKFEDAEPANIRLSLVLLNDIALAGVSGEVLTSIGLRLKRESPLAHTIMVTHANGLSGYIPDDAAYDQVSYEILSSRFKRGCAENAIVGGFLDMIEQQR